MEVPEYYMAGYYSGQFSPEKRISDQKMGEHFAVDELLDFPNEETLINDGNFDKMTANSTDSSPVNAVAGYNPSVPGKFGSRSFLDSHFSSELCVPYDELADQLEWLSNFTEDSFSSEELQNLHLISGGGVKPNSPESSTSDTARNNNSIFNPEVPLPGKARSKRSRAPPCDWSTRVFHVAGNNAGAHEPAAAAKTTAFKKRENSNSDNVARKCLHCAAEKTPQWRTGPMGPKTLCNACGVRYKSGRLVPEYRPAASPTFVSAKHSNSHRKVMELRRQKELARQHQQQLIGQNPIFGLSNGGDDYLIHHHSETNYHLMI